MLSNLICWIIAIGIMLSGSVDRNDLYIKTALALGFILVGTISKAVDVYRIAHSNNNAVSTEAK